MNFSQNNEVRVAIASETSSDDQDGSTIDAQGLSSVTMIYVPDATTTGTAVLRAQGGDVDPPTSDLEGAAVDISADDDNQIFWIEIHRPLQRYVRMHLTKTGDIGGTGLYILSGHAVLPVQNNVADAVTGSLHISPIVT